MDTDDRFALLLTEIDNGHGSMPLGDLAQRYAYVYPDDASLALLAKLGPIVEIGAGTGYWASRLRSRGVDLVAFDQAPPDGEQTNRYHAPTATWSEVGAADQTVLTEHSDRVLFLCWPPLFSSLGDCLTFYGGNTVALIGDGGHRTARLHGLNETFGIVSVSAVRALEPLSGATPTLSIWRRHDQDSAQSQKGGSLRNPRGRGGQNTGPLSKRQSQPGSPASTRRWRIPCQQPPRAGCERCSPALQSPPPRPGRR